MTTAIKTDFIIFGMLTESTGTHFLDSGGCYGRHWERNQKKSFDEFLESHEATLEITVNVNNNEPYFDFTANVFHALKNNLSYDSLCEAFADLPCDEWDGDFYGTSKDQSDWLKNRDFKPKNEGFNTYNFDCPLSQVLQGQELEREGEEYLLLQIHQGADVRGGYTDAKLFLLDDDEAFYRIINPYIHSEFLSWSGELINIEGQPPSDEELQEIAKKMGCGTHEAFICS